MATERPRISFDFIFAISFIISLLCSNFFIGKSIRLYFPDIITDILAGTGAAVTIGVIGVVLIFGNNQIYYEI
jgi:hypothetical protein